MSQSKQAIGILTMNTLAFTISFACWMTYGVLITWLVANRVFDWTSAEMGMIIGVPVLTGSVTRLPVGMLTDRYGGKPVFTVLLLLSAIPMYFVSACDSTMGFILAGLGFGITGASFAVGIAFTSVWFSKERQGTALGIFGAGNAGAAITSLAAPTMLNAFTDNGANLEAWRTLPKIYAAALVVTAILFFLFTTNRKPEGVGKRSIKASLSTLKHIRVWRFGMYYFLVFGMFVALAQWLIPYYVNVYAMSIVTAGLMATIFTLPSGVIRALGGTLSDKFGARRVMYWVLGLTLTASVLLIVPKMEVFSPGKGVMATGPGVVTAVEGNTIKVDDQVYTFNLKPASSETHEEQSSAIFPNSQAWQEPNVKVGDKVKKKALLAKGVTRIDFQANMWIFTALVFVIGITLGIGKAAVYRHIPDYFPNDVGIVGGMVGVLGGLGGFFGPMIFGALLSWSGLWTTTWLFVAVLTAVCLVWMHRVIQKMMRQKAPELMRKMDISDTQNLGKVS